MEDSTFTIFIIFGCLWILMGGIAWVAFLKSEGQPIRFGKWGLLVTVPIVVPLIIAFAVAAIYH